MPTTRAADTNGAPARSVRPNTGYNAVIVTRIHFDFGRCTVLVNGVAILADSHLGHTFCAATILHANPRDAFSVEQLAIRAAAPSIKSMRQGLRLLAQSDVVQISNDQWRARHGDWITVSPAKPMLRQWLSVHEPFLKRRRASQGRRNRPKAIQGEAVESELARLEQRIKTANYQNVRTALTPEAIRRLEQGSPNTLARVRRGLVAQTLASEAFMVSGDWQHAGDHAQKAIRWLDRLDGSNGLDSPLYWRIRILGALAASRRMGAAILSARDAERSSELIHAARTTYQESLARVLADTSLPQELGNERLRWMHATNISASVHTRDQAASRTHLREAERWAPLVSGDGADVVETALLACRYHLVAGDVGPARTALADAEAYAAGNPFPPWVLCWFPTYRADVARRGMASDSALQALLREGWKRNKQTGFQRLRILARWATWGIEPCNHGSKDADFREDVLRFLSPWHGRITGVPASGCPTCSPQAGGHRLLPRIQCTMRLAVGEGLGLWA